jgi:hypothetical protein
MQGEIASVNPEDLRKVWEAFPLMWEQHAGGTSNREMVAKLAPGADFVSLIAHCAVLKNDIDCGKIDPKAIDFVEAAKPIPLSL